MLNATIVARKGTSKKSVGVTRREKRAKNLSHQMLRGVQQIPQIMAKFSAARQQLFQKAKNGYLISGSLTQELPSTRPLGENGSTHINLSQEDLYIWKMIMPWRSLALVLSK